MVSPLKRFVALLFCCTGMFLISGCQGFSSIQSELNACSHSRTEWLKHAEPAVREAEIYMRTADATHPSIEMAIKAAGCADVDFLIAMKKNGFREWNNPFIILAGGKTPYPVVVKLLHGWGADLNAKYSDGAAVIHCAAHHGQLDVVRYLVEEGVAINTPDNGGMTPLHWAASANQEAVVRFLVEAGADVSARDKDGKRPADHCSSEELRKILSKK